MDNQNDKWLDDILSQRQDNEKESEEQQAAADVALTRSDEQELERIVQETIAENWGESFDVAAPDADSDATQFFAPHTISTSIPVDEITAEAEISEDTEPTEDEEAYLQSIFDAVATDSALLVDDVPAAESEEGIAEESTDEASDAEDTDAQSDNASDIDSGEAAEAASESLVDAEESSEAVAAPIIVPPVLPEEGAAAAAEPLLNADEIIREILAEDPRNKEKLSEEAIINDILAEAAAETPTAQPDLPEEPEPEKPIRKMRPARKEGYGLFGIPHIVSTAVWAAIILFIGITLGRTVWLCAVDLLALGKTGREATITVNEEDSIADIARKLEATGMIDYPTLFEMFADLTKKSEDIKPGTYTFDGKLIYDYNALINTMSQEENEVNTIDITIPEGYTCKQIFALLQEKGVCNAELLGKYAKEGELPEYWFLEGINRNTEYCLEGFLYPDTYNFYLDSQPKQVIEKFLETFDLRFTARLKEKREQLNADLGLNMSMYDIMIMASMVEKEKADTLEGYTIASVFYNRIVDSYNNPSSKYHYLGCDATIDYAEDVFAGHTAVIDAYDTYKVRGLPPTPICNPGLPSIDAALAPESSEYYYFVLNKETNKHVFAETEAEHEKNKQELGYYD